MKISALVASVVLSVAAPLLAACPAPTGTTAPSAGGTYPVPTPIATIITDDKAFAAFAKSVRHDLEVGATDKDPAVAKERLFVLAMLDGLDNKWDQAIETLDKASALETDPIGKQMLGLTIRVWSDAQSDSSPDAFKAAFDARLSAMKLDQVGDELVVLRTLSQSLTSTDVCAQQVAQEVGPHVSQGTVGIDDAHAIVFMRYAAMRLVPVRLAIDETLNKHGIASAEGAAAPTETVAPDGAAAP
ncbi:MAG TPA: hypothetical protein VGM90_08720 [Kofleriaceae bacterium]|jgi:hypothetical protein